MWLSQGTDELTHQLICDIMAGVKRLTKCVIRQVIISVSSNELTHTVHDWQLHFLGHILRNTRYPHIITLCTIPASSCHNKTWLSLT